MKQKDLRQLRDRLLVAVRDAAETGASTNEIVATFRNKNRHLVELVTTALVDISLARLVSNVAKRRGAKRLVPSQQDLFGTRLSELLTVPESADGKGRSTQWRRFGSLKVSFAKRVVNSQLELRRKQDKFRDFEEIIALCEPYAKKSPDMSVDDAYALYVAANSATGGQGEP